MFKSPFTASRLQVATYLLGVALFSISFLVFLNSSVSFVISDLLGQKAKIGDAAGTLGFADELVALVACPIWGMISDRLSTRNVVTLGYTIVGLSLFVFVHAHNVYPQLLLARLFFSVGGAATATMVTAILPTMTTHLASRAVRDAGSNSASQPSNLEGDSPVCSDSTLRPATFDSRLPEHQTASRSAASQVAGLVGMFTGLGALIALGAFLPLPAWFRDRGYSPGPAVQASFYLVGAVALAVALICFVGLRHLPGEENKGWARFFSSFNLKSSWKASPSGHSHAYSFPRLLAEAVVLGFTNIPIGLGYLGGFIARASSVGISLFIPLYINAYFIASGLCKDDPASDPADVKRHCRRAYTLAAALTGSSQVFALIGAPVFGWLDGRFRRFHLPLVFAALCGVIGYTILGQTKCPDPKDKNGGPGIFVVMMLLGISQIGAIVCSLSLLSRGIDGNEQDLEPQSQVSTISSQEVAAEGRQDSSAEHSSLLPSHLQRQDAPIASRSHLKGSIAGVYSLTGGAGIILLTKLGGYLFDSLSTGAPFYMLAVFNGVLLVAAIACAIGAEIRRKRDRITL